MSTLSREHLYQNVHPDGHCFMQDNDPKHTSKLAQRVLEEEGVNWWKTPAERVYLQGSEALLQGGAGIHNFWETVTVSKCQKYIRHLRKVIPKVIEVQGAATGF